MKEKREQWRRLSELLDLIDRHGLRELPSPELLEFGRLYRRAVSDLSFARTHGLDPQVKEHLNHLVGRAYGHVYRAESKGFSLAAMRRFFRVEFPLAVRRNWIFLVVAFGVFFLGLAIAFGMALYDPLVARALLPEEVRQAIDNVVERHRQAGDWLPGMIRPVASSSIMTNNIGVAFLAFSTGILAGIGALYVLFFNGLMLGAVAAAVAQAGMKTSINFWAFVLPHGVLELPAIFLAGAAGLILGYTLIDPGDYDRKTALKLAARRALSLVFGVIAMLVVAGIIEAFFSPTLLPEPLKLAVSTLVLGGLISYLFWLPLPQERIPD